MLDSFAVLGGGSPFWVGVYLSSMALITLVALILSRETTDLDLERRPRWH